MYDILILHRTKLLAGLAVLFFLFFVWPTPYVITRGEGHVYRVNRFTGVRQQATDKGWRTEVQIARDALMEAGQKEARENAERRARTREVLRDLAQVNDNDHRPYPGEIILHNPTGWEMEGAYSKMTVEYYELMKDGSERFLAREEVPAATIGADSRTKIEVFNRGHNEWAPAEVEALREGTPYRQKITITVRRVRDTRKAAADGETPSVDLDPAYVFTTTWEFRRARSG